jgi:uncharacterized protein (DUF427 family)
MLKEKPFAGQESVWDYPRPPRLEPSSKSVRVFFAKQLIAESAAAYRVLETSHPPSWYIPRNDVRMEFLTATARTSFCEWKGNATYFTARIADEIAQDAAWSYASPNPRFAVIKDCLAFYPNRFECFVDDERVQPQPGGFYGGWITSDVLGPFKGIPGSSGW